MYEFKQMSSDPDELIPPGKRYRCKAINVSLSESRRGTEMLGVELQFLDPEVNGYTMWWTGYFTDNAFPITYRALKALGYDGVEIAELVIDNPEELASAMEKHFPNEVFAVVQHEPVKRPSAEYDPNSELVETGEYRARVAFINSTQTSGALGTPMDAGKRAAFSAQMRAQFEAAHADSGSLASQELDPDTGEPLRF